MSTTVTVTEFYMCQYKTLDFDTLYFVGVYRCTCASTTTKEIATTPRLNTSIKALLNGWTKPQTSEVSEDSGASKASKKLSNTKK